MFSTLVSGRGPRVDFGEETVRAQVAQDLSDPFLRYPLVFPRVPAVAEDRVRRRPRGSRGPDRERVDPPPRPRQVRGS